MSSGPGPEVTPLVEAEIESVDLVPGRTQERHQNGSDITTITRNEHPHSQNPSSG